MADNTPIDTGEKTVTGRIIWNDPETGKDYSERSTTFKIDGKYYTMPTVAEDGTQYTDDQIRDYVKEHGPFDYLTGEELPEFRYREDALQYAVSRSDTRKQKKALGMEKGGILTQTGSNNYGLPVNRDEEAPSIDEETQPEINYGIPPERNPSDDTDTEENRLLELQKKLSFMKEDLYKNKKYKFFSKQDADGNAIPFIMFKSDEVMSMDDVKRVFQENNSGPEPVPRAITAKKVIDYLEKANPTKGEFINYFSSVELNKGGIPMKRQMEMFSEGGLNQEGGMVDEVSGNEVPMGSTREEVRDDIPAQVSEGEFIFPADVVRYLGLEKLMKLRQTAKMGLKQMDAMGQMGNSDEATMPDDMPFGIADLVVIDGPDEEEPQKKYKGGLSFANGGISMPDFDRSSQDVRIYVKEGSPDKRVPFFNGEPVISIENLLAQGYVLKGSEPVEETETEEAIPTRKSSDRTPMKKTPFQEAGGWSMKLGDPPDPAKVKLWTDEYAKTSGRTPAVLTGIATVIGGPLGILVHLANKGNAKSAAANYERVLKAAQQTNVKGQVKALRDINTEVIKGKEGEDKSILVKIIDGLKDALGFSDDEVNEAVTVAGKSDQETPEEKTAKEAARLAAIKNFRDEEDKLFNDQSMTVAEGEKITAEAAATAKAAAAKTETERMLSINDPKGTSLEDKAEVERMLSINDPKGTSLEDKAAREAKEAAATAANVAAKKAAAAERIKNTELVSTIPGAAVATTDTDAALEAGAAPEVPKVSGPDPNNLFSPRNQITAGAGQLGFDINTIDNTTLNNMEVAINEINSGADAGEAITRVNPNVGLALQNLAQTYFTGGVDSMADFTFGSSTGVERDGRSNEEIVSTALESFDDESLARIDAGTNRFEEQRKKEAEEAKAARKAKRRPQELKEELKQKADFNARATKGSENLALKRSIARAREAVPTRTNDELINIAKQTVAGQAAGKGYVGGFGFKKGGLASRKK